MIRIAPPLVRVLTIRVPSITPRTEIALRGQRLLTISALVRVQDRAACVGDAGDRAGVGEIVLVVERRGLKGLRGLADINGGVDSGFDNVDLGRVAPYGCVGAGVI